MPPGEEHAVHNAHLSTPPRDGGGIKVVPDRWIAGIAGSLFRIAPTTRWRPDALCAITGCSAAAARQGSAWCSFFGYVERGDAPQCSRRGADAKNMPCTMHIYRRLRATPEESRSFRIAGSLWIAQESRSFRIAVGSLLIAWIACFAFSASPAILNTSAKISPNRIKPIEG